MAKQKKTAAALQGSAEQFKLLVQGVTDYALYMLDLDGRVASWNLGGERIKGYPPDEIIGQHFSRFYTPEDRENGEPARALSTALDKGSYTAEGWRVRKDGTRFWASVVLDAVRDESGQIIGFAKITRDITERRNAQEQLDMAKEALLQSQKMDAIGQLTGGIAHDFNNLLMAILSSLELLRKRVGNDPRATTLLENAMLGAKRGAALTQRMLAFARRQHLEFQIVDLQTRVLGIMEMLERSLGPSIHIEARFAAPLKPVMVDPNQFDLALLNLAVNARDAMPDGGRLVIAGREELVGEHTARNLRPGRYVCLSVTDTGSGMDKQTLSRAVEPFFTTKGVGKGTGLGLSMVHGLAEQSGGRLLLSSVLKRGTVAELWLPVAAGEVDPAQVPRSGDALAATGQPLTIVVVDDDELVLTNLEAMLEDLGHHPLPAANARSALAILRGSRADLVITDHAMPGMNGADLAAAIAKEWPGLPVVVTTGFAELPGGIEATAPRLLKPFGSDDLARVIVATMSRSGPHDGGAATAGQTTTTRA